MSAKSRVTFALPLALKNEIHGCVIKDGYGLRGKSKWISEAIEKLLMMKNYPDLINYNDEMHGFDTMETITLEHQVKLALEIATLQIRKKYPMTEGVKSRMLRTATIQRILRR